MKNMMVALMVSNGVPLILMSDEIMSTRYGNNNYYGHDSDMKHFDWGKVDDLKDGYWRFYRCALLNAVLSAASCHTCTRPKD